MSAARRDRPRYEGDPTLLRVMVRPQWIAALLLAIAVAAAFAWLGRWQLDHAIRVDPGDTESISETVRPLTGLTGPGEAVTDRSAGMVVSLDGALVPEDLTVVEARAQGGREGAWVVGHLSVRPEGHLAVALGWAPTAGDAERAAASLRENPDAIDLHGSVEGRYMPSDGAVAPRADEDPSRVTTMSVGQLINLWQPFDGPAYAGYLVLHPHAPVDTALSAAGLSPIDSVPPLPAETVNWLNLFYAAEWVVFAGFAVFFWYRITRDAWEREHETKALAARAGDHDDEGDQ